MQCPKCQFENTERAKTCARCGTVLNLSGSHPEEPAQNRGRSRCVIGCAVAALLMIGLIAVAFPRFARVRERATSRSCLSNVKQLQLAIIMYAQDYDEVMPSATNWCDATLPYGPHWADYICPYAEAGGGEGVATYAMNDAVSGQDLSAIPSPEATVCIFDSATGWNMHGGPSLVVNRDNRPGNVGFIESMVHRHIDGAHFGFVDGHAKWVYPGSMSKYTWDVSATPATGGP